MILSATLSKPTAAVRDALGNDFIRVKIKLHTASKHIATAGKNVAVQNDNADDAPQYITELFTKTQVFHKKLTAAEVDDFLAAHEGTTFRACVERTETEEITILANKKGKVTRLAKPIRAANGDDFAKADAARVANKSSLNTQAALQVGSIPSAQAHIVSATGTGCAATNSLNRTKNYIIPEGEPVPFLVHLGVMTAQGKVIAAKYDKFRQINRFLEYVDDILSDLLSAHAKDGIGALENSTNTQASPLHIVDFGSGKSYLTFAVHYFLTEIRHVACETRKSVFA